MLLDHKIGPTLPPAHHLNFILTAELPVYFVQQYSAAGKKCQVSIIISCCCYLGEMLIVSLDEGKSSNFMQIFRQTTSGAKF